ncbi:hypothetical protein BBJ28_00004683 [Nothophytophthora sp. Chile5]|nr:hypothetical protein BBJ28_00004683 [Nothophytophthora sp. Chile5]
MAETGDAAAASRRRRNRVDDDSDEEEDAQYELTEDEDGDEGGGASTESEGKADEPAPPRKAPGKRKRKRDVAEAPNDDDEIARRRRRRRSLAFQQRRKSLTPSTSKTTAGPPPPKQSRQYISDMYSTIIKMSSENSADDTYNFQKASCTLDASIKIYSYRVDDTWNSSYKILENLSRTEQKHGAEEAESDGEGGEGNTTRKTARKTHARTIEKNLNNINLKSFDMEFEADPLFHKMSQSFDEGGAKGMLLANLSVYDGCKILLNSADVSVATRKPIVKAQEQEQEQDQEAQAKTDADTEVDADAEAQADEEGKAQADGKAEGEGGAEAEIEIGPDEDAEPEVETQTDAEKEGGEEEEARKEEDADDSTEEAKDEEEETSAGPEKSSDTPPATAERISLSIFGSLPCIDQDVQDLSVCPPLHRLYEQLDEYYGDEARHKVGIKTEFLQKTPVKGRRKQLEKSDAVAMNLGAIMEDADGEDSDAEADNNDMSVDFFDDTGEYDGDEDGNDTGVEGEEATGEATEDVDMEKEGVDLAEANAERSPHEDSLPEGSEHNPVSLDKEASLTSSATDFFRAKLVENLPENYESNLFSQMIESALVRSATLEDEQGGEDVEGKNDYSYFDVKMLRNWAGPVHWKFPAVRKIQQKQQQTEAAEKEALAEVHGEDGEDGLAIKAEGTERTRKGSSAGMDKKAAVLVDFFGEEPDLSKLKAPKSAASLQISKFYVTKQTENASDLVFPVDTHIEIGLFFQHFLKGKLRFFNKKHSSGFSEGAQREGATASGLDYGGSSGDTADDKDDSQSFGYNDDSAGFDGGYDDDDGGSGAEDHGTDAMYSTAGLVQADRMVEKIGVHYERFAKRVDVKKLKGSIWDHLEKDTAAKGSDSVDTAAGAAEEVAKNESGKRPREQEADNDLEKLDTTFESVIENVSGKVRGASSVCAFSGSIVMALGGELTVVCVSLLAALQVPSNVTVSFYFICVLHLANEKGLELIGQDDLRNFQIRKETE